VRNRLERLPTSARLPLRFIYVMVAGRAALVYLPLAIAFFVAWWQNGMLLWYASVHMLLQFGLTGWAVAEAGVPAAQVAISLAAVASLVVAGARVGWAERGRQPNDSQRMSSPTT
jgi:hypothetical protein